MPAAAGYYSRHSSTSRSSRSSRNSVSSSVASSSYGGSCGSLLGSSSFQVGRERDRSAEMELFSTNRKPRSNYRRPSHLGLSLNPIQSKSEAKLQYTPLPASRSHIVPKIPDHLRPEGGFRGETVNKAIYRNLSPARPRIHKILDTLKPEGRFSMQSETNLVYDDKKSVRPIIHKLLDHDAAVKPMLRPMGKSSEYRNNFKTMKGERPPPAWVTNFEKVTIDGTAGGKR